MQQTKPKLESNPPRREMLSPTEKQALQSDAELLELFIESGSREAIESLIRRYSSMVASVCRCTVADPASAEDAFQATFLVLLKSAKKIRRSGSVAAWLHGVAYRTASRLRKQRLVQVTNESADEVIAKNDSIPDPIVTLARQMELEALDQELQKLPTRLRDVLVEHYLLGNTAPQIAERMELSTSAVEGRIRRGRQALRRVLAQRGISLSIVVASSAWFQQQVQATEAATWTTSFLDTHYPVGTTSPNFSANPSVSSLVQGELTMFGATYSKVLAVAASVLLLIGGLLSFNAIGDEGGQDGDGSAANRAKKPLTIESLPKEPPPVVAQFGGAPVPVKNEKPAATNQSDPVATPEPKPTRPEPIQWMPPEADAPEWLDRKLTNSQVQENIRANLSSMIQVDFNGVPLSEALETLSRELDVEVFANEAALSNSGGDLDLPIALRSKGPAREILRRLLQKIADAELDYLVRDSGIEITTRGEVNNDPATRYYDLSFVLPNSDNSESLMAAIQTQINPDDWLNGGGTWSMSLVGSLLIVGCSESAHYRIETMLSRIAAMNRANLEQQVPSTAYPYGGGMGGMGGGMGGMGGGMGGMGGGMF